MYVFQTWNVIFINVVCFDFQGLNAYISANYIVGRLVLVVFCHKF